MGKNQKEIYEYADGSGNKYIITNTNDFRIFIEYIPIKPHLSSSGLYDGGDYKQKEISKLNYKKVVALFDTALKNKKDHLENRIKTSGLLSIQEEDKKKICILAPNSKNLRKIEKLLQDIMNF